MIKKFQSKLLANLFLIYCFRDNEIPSKDICKQRIRKLLGYIHYDKIVDKDFFYDS